MKRAGIFSIVLIVISQNVKGQDLNRTHNCDSLYQTKQFFEFRDSVLDWQESPSPEHRYFRGLAEAVFNQPSKAVKDLTAYLDHTSHTDSVSRLGNAFDVLGTSYFRLYQYADATKTYREAIRRLGDEIDSSQRLDFENSARLGEILSGAPHQQIMAESTGQAHILPSKAGKYQISVKMNDEVVDSDLIFDTGANFSILDSTTAASCHVKLLNGTISVGSLTGNPTTAHVGVIDKLDIGMISLRNVVVLVFQDADLSFPSIHYHVTGAIGFPVIEALGTVTFTSDGHIEASIRQRKTSSTMRPNLALDGLNLVVEVAYLNQLIPLHYDTGADATMFYPPFLRRFPSVLTNADTSTHKFSGAGGELINAKAYKLRNLQLQLDGKTISFDSVKAVTDRVNETAEFFYGNLGRDATKQFSATTLDFRTMSLRLE
jgi:hypothetical protein